MKYRCSSMTLCDKSRDGWRDFLEISDQRFSYITSLHIRIPRFSLIIRMPCLLVICSTRSIVCCDSLLPEHTSRAARSDRRQGITMKDPSLLFFLTSSILLPLSTALPSPNPNSPPILLDKCAKEKWRPACFLCGVIFCPAAMVYVSLRRAPDLLMPKQFCPSCAVAEILGLSKRANKWKVEEWERENVWV